MNCDETLSPMARQTERKVRSFIRGYDRHRSHFLPNEAMT